MQSANPQPAYPPQAIAAEQTDMPVGAVLKRARQHYNQTLEDIERALRIRASQIEAIENGDFSVLPGRVYAIGFIRSYSEYLGLDGDAMVALFKTQSGAAERPELHFPATPAESKTAPVWLAAVAIVVAVLLLAVWWQVQGSGKGAANNIPRISPELAAQVGADDAQTPEATPDITDDAAQPEAAATQAQSAQTAASAAPDGSAQTAANQPQAASEPAAVQEGILLVMKESSWVEIKDSSGKAVVSRVLNAGEKYFVPSRPDLRMSMGNSGGIEITVDGVLLRPLGALGAVRRNVPLDAAYLKTNFGLSPEEAAKAGAATPAAAASGEKATPSAPAKKPEEAHSLSSVVRNAEPQAGGGEEPDVPE